jgi:hypothetical protein
MRNTFRRLTLSTGLALATAVAFVANVPGQVVINEIMYHPASQSPRDEWIELHNRSGTNVSLAGWRLRAGVDFNFPSNAFVPPGGFLVVAGHRPSFQASFPGATNVVGDFVVMRTTNVAGYTLTNWQNTLSNTRDTIGVEDAAGQTVDEITYADEGDWAQRQRGPLDRTFRGWKWFAAHDGLGSSLELRNAALPNEHGQNWRASSAVNGTPGAANSTAANNIAPLILGVSHFPVVPRSTNLVSVTARLVDELSTGLAAGLAWRVDAATPPPFQTNAMFDDGAHGDGLPGDGIFGATIPAQANNAVVEFFVIAGDGQGNTRTWPSAALAAPDAPGSSTQAANALYQVDDNAANDFNGTSPLFKMIFTEAERAELASIPCGSFQDTDAEMNATFIYIDGSGTDVRYQNGVRNRGNSSRCANPPNYRVNFPADRPVRGMNSLNLNTVQVYLQHFGSTIANKSGAVGPYSRAVRVRVNNVDRARSGSPMFGHYAANEAFNADWAENHFPEDGGGNAYRAQRNIDPSEFDYRGEEANSYRNTYLKESNVSEDDWRDLIAMHAVMGLNGTVPFTNDTVRQVINPEQWLTHLAVMALMNNSESGLNSGHNDDYSMYRGVNDPRFILVFHDLDQLFDLGGQPFGPTDTIFGATYIQGEDLCCRSSGDNDGSGRMMKRFMLSPNFQPLYYTIMQRLLDTTFSKPQFDALLDQTLGHYATPTAINNIRNFMDARRAHVQSVISGLVPPPTNNPVAVITGEPRVVSPYRTATINVGGEGVTHYRFRLNNGSYSAEMPVATPISLANLPQGSTNTVYVIGRNAANIWQSSNAPTVSGTWVVNTNAPTVRLNELLAANVAAAPHSGTFPDTLELFNESAAPVSLAGLRLSDSRSDPNKFTFPNGTSIPANGYLLVYLNNADGTPGLHAGFSVNVDGAQVYLFDRATNGNVVLDSVSFGPQIPDLSIGRVNGSQWALTQPTFGSVNTTQPLGSASGLRINEWLAASLSADDWVEIYNPSAQPVSLAGLFMSDRPVGDPRKHRFADLSFIAANTFRSFLADGSDDPESISFQLESEYGEIALLAPTLSVIDCVIYGAQINDVTMGRCPDGGYTNRFLTFPTPDAMNACPVAPPGPQTLTLVSYSDIWRFNQFSNLYATNWTQASYPDSAWPNSGPGAFANSQISGVAVNTPINNTTGTVYFRTTFVLPTNANFSSIQLGHFFDDGAVVYVNGREAYRYNMNPGAVDHSTRAASNNNGSPSEVTVSNFPLTNAVPGVNVLAVSLHPRPDFFPGGDAVMGLKLEGLIITNSAASAGVVINEVLADNASAEEPDGSTPDWVEIYNPSQSAVDLAGMRLVGAAPEQSWTFPSGSIIGAQGYFRVRFDSDLPASSTNTGWGLNTRGDTLTLFNSAANGGGPRDFINFGLQIADFSIARLPSGSTNWNLALPTIGSANLAATLGNPAALKVNEWMANPAPGDDDFIELYNPGAQPVALGGLWLSDTFSERNKHQIAALSFIGSVTNAWADFKADGNTTLGAHHLNFSLRASREDVVLSMPNLTLIDGISFTNHVEGVSQGRLPDGGTNIVSFVGTVSPGSANFLVLSNVVINEVLTHSDLPFEDAIEIRNLTASAINIGGWWLSDARGEPQKFQIPPGTILPANGYRVFYENAFNDPGTAVVPFSLSSAKGDQVFLSAATNGSLTGLRAFVEFDAAENGVSFGRYVNSVGEANFVAMSSRSFGVDNPTTVEQFRTGAGAVNAYPKVGPVVVSELMYNPPRLGTNDNTRDEFVELRNITGAAVPLYDVNFPTNRWRLRGAVDFDFPAFTSIPANSALVVVSFDPATNATDAAAFRTTYGLASNVVLHGPWSGKLDNGGEDVKLQKPDAPQQAPNPDAGLVPYIVVDAFGYSDVPPWPTNADGFGSSLQRVSLTGFANDPTNWLAAAPNPQPPIGGSGDTDNDGMPNTWEDLYGFNSGNPADAAQDADNDGMTNLQEYRAGTHPRDASSRLAISISVAGTGARLQFGAVSNVSYTLQHRTSLSTGAWLNLQVLPAAPSNRTVAITNTPPSATRFYRLTTP